MKNNRVNIKIFSGWGKKCHENIFLCIKNIQTFSTPKNVMFYSWDLCILYDWKQVLCALEQIPIL